ncbi:MAG: hypothetical protein WC326_08325 [Candidatus Delongbacteria bacterium]
MDDLKELRRQVSFLDESVRTLQVLLDPGYGGTASELVRLLQELETRDATAATRLAQLEEESLRWYQPDGSYDVLACQEEVVARRKAAAKNTADLIVMLRRALRQIEPNSETALEVRKDGIQLLNTIGAAQGPRP